MVLMRSAWVLAMLAVTVLALLPVEHLQSPVFDGWDKAQHALAFWVLTGWALLLWPNAAMRVVVGMLAYGAGLEVAQWAVGWRFAEWADVAADAVGVGLAWVCVAGWRRRNRGQIPIFLSWRAQSAAIHPRILALPSVLMDNEIFLDG